MASELRHAVVATRKAAQWQQRNRRVYAKALSSDILNIVARSNSSALSPFPFLINFELRSINVADFNQCLSTECDGELLGK